MRKRTCKPSDAVERITSIVRTMGGEDLVGSIELGLRGRRSGPLPITLPQQIATRLLRRFPTNGAKRNGCHVTESPDLPGVKNGAMCVLISLNGNGRNDRA